MKKILIVGLGNTIRGDDGIGIAAIRLMRDSLAVSPGVKLEFREVEEAQINLLEFFADYDKLVIIDAICIKDSKPGNIHRITADRFKKEKSAYSTHQIGLPRIIKMAQDLNIQMPGNIVIYAVEIEDKDEFSCEVSPQLKKALPGILELVRKELTLSN